MAFYYGRVGLARHNIYITVPFFAVKSSSKQSSASPKTSPDVKVHQVEVHAAPSLENCEGLEGAVGGVVSEKLLIIFYLM